MTMIDPMPPPVPAAATSPTARPGTPDFLRWLQAASGREVALSDAAQQADTQQAVTQQALMQQAGTQQAGTQQAVTQHAAAQRVSTPLPPGAELPSPPAVPQPPMVVSEPVDIARLADVAQHAGVGALWSSGGDDAMTHWLPAGQVALRLRGGDGQEALFALPWRLAANGRLEHVRLSMLPLWLVQGMPPAGVSTPSAGVATPGSSPALAAVPAGAPAAGGGSTPLLPTHASSDATRSARATPTEDAATLARAPTFGEWALRWTRWIERDGRDPAVWLRDFRLDEQGVRRLTDTLRAFAREHGFALERIVVNGREQWRASSAEPYATSLQQPQE